MNCSRCNKRLSRKTARMIDGKLLCSLFGPRRVGCGPRDLTLVLSPPMFRSQELPASFPSARLEPCPRLRCVSVRTSTQRAGLNRRITAVSSTATDPCVAQKMSVCNGLAAALVLGCQLRSKQGDQPEFAALVGFTARQRSSARTARHGDPTRRVLLTGRLSADRLPTSSRMTLLTLYADSYIVRSYFPLSPLRGRANLCCLASSSINRG